MVSNLFITAFQGSIRLIVKGSSLMALCLLLGSVISLTFNTVVHAAEEETQLVIETTLLTKGPIYARQPVTVSITVLTNRWFSKGTRLGTFEIPTAVVLPTGQFAINGTRKINYQTWTTQTRDITFYPIEAGKLQIPAIKFDVSASGPNGESIDSELYSDAIEIFVEYPVGLDDTTDYVVTDEYRIESTLNRSIEDEFKVGDAITQTYSFQVNGTPGMMLPTLADINMPGIKIYRTPEKLLDTRNRGALTGIKEEKFTYFLESAGDYVLPEQTFYWYNTNTGTVDTIIIPAKKLHVVGLTGIEKLKDDIYNVKFSPTKIVNLVVISLIFLFVLTILIRNRGFLVNLYKTITKYEQRQIEALYIGAIKKQQYRLACHYLYQRYDISNNTRKNLRRLFIHDKALLTTFNGLFTLAFEPSKAGNIKQINVAVAKTLLLKNNKGIRKSANDNSYNIDDYIDLNNR